MTIHAALTDKKYAIPIHGIPTKTSDKFKQQREEEGIPQAQFVHNIINTHFSIARNLKVDRDNWYDRNTDMKINSKYILSFLIATRDMSNFRPLHRMRAHHTPTPPFGYCQMGQAGSGSSPKVRGGRRKESAGRSAV